MKIWIEKYKDVIPYAIFGVLTTIVNLGSYWSLTRLMSLNVMSSTIVAWINGVLFAYFTNRKWVFKSDKHGIAAIVKEMLYFFSCRLFTGIIDWIIMFAFADTLKFCDVYVKAIANMVVILLNYVFSKTIIFKKGE